MVLAVVKLRANQQTGGIFKTEQNDKGLSNKKCLNDITKRYNNIFC